MTLLLPFLFSMVGIGLLTERLDRRVYLLVVGAAILTTIIYYGFRRFWT